MTRHIYAAAISPAIDRVRWSILEQMAEREQMINGMIVWHHWLRVVPVDRVAVAT